MQCHPITGFLGAEISGLKISDKISEKQTSFLKNALSKYLVIVLPDQFLTAEQQRGLANVFGAPAINPYARGCGEYPEMTIIVKEVGDTTGVFGGGWHTDLSFLDLPPRGSILSAIEVPPYGGDTMYLSQQAAWSSLPKPLAQLLEGRKVSHVGKPYGVRWAPPVEEQSMKGSTTRNDPDADRERWHPAVLKHPITKKKGLYINPTYAHRLEGFDEDKSTTILQMIYDHCALPEHCLRLRWRNGMVVIWDNYFTQHYAINDYHGFRREMRRVAYQNFNSKGPIDFQT